MQGTHQDFLAPFQVVIAETISIGSLRGDLSTEIQTNVWQITLSHEQCEDPTTSDLLR
jgi:hypothetical protein